MDYKSKYLKYKNKYQHLLKLVGGADTVQSPEVLRAIEESKRQQQELELGMALSLSEGQQAERQAAQQAEINLDFERRLRDARILVIGASFTNNFAESDDIRWGMIDPNFLGVSHGSRDPIGKLGSWDDNPDEYWPKVFGEILRNRKFDAIYLDRGTFQHLVHHRQDKHGYNSFYYESFKKLVKYIYDNQITDKFYLEFDLLNIDKNVERRIPTTFFTHHSKYKIDFDISLRSYERAFSLVIKFFYSYFKCCGDTQDIFMDLNENGEQVFSKWIAYLRR